MRPTLAPLVAASFFLALSCGDSSNAPGAEGSAGTLDGPDVVLTAATEAVYTAGALDGEDWETFGAVGTVAFDGAGNLHILDTQADRIVVVAPDGSFVRTVGGPGEGPGEFRSTTGLIVDRDGGYVVTSFNGMQIFGPGGDYLQSIPLDPFKGVPMRAERVLAGRLVHRCHHADQQTGREGRSRNRPRDEGAAHRGFSSRR